MTGTLNLWSWLPGYQIYRLYISWYIATHTRLISWYTAVWLWIHDVVHKGEFVSAVRTVLQLIDPSVVLERWTGQFFLRFNRGSGRSVTASWLLCCLWDLGTSVGHIHTAAVHWNHTNLKEIAAMNNSVTVILCFASQFIKGVLLWPDIAWRLAYRLVMVHLLVVKESCVWFPVIPTWIKLSNGVVNWCLRMVCWCSSAKVV